jgi:Uma2 family endonuclease
MSSSTSIKNLAQLVDRLGGVPLDRIRLHPYPATVQDIVEIQDREGRSCELIEGVLLEKTVGYNEATFAGFILTALNNFLDAHTIGIASGADGTMEIMPDLVRIPDVSFTSWDRLPGRKRPKQPVPHLAPNLAVEVLSESNTAREMKIKRHEYFVAGVELVWEVDLEARTIAIHRSETDSQVLTEADTLEGGSVLPGFTLPIATLFAKLDRQG